MKDKFLKPFLRHLLVILIIIFYYFLLHILEVTCLIRGTTNIPCPGCGSTRAMLALLRGDFKGYIYYHPGAILILLTVFVAFHSESLFKVINKKTVNIFIIINSLIIIIIYFVRLMFSIIP
ncbi:MAG TPA: DUF2752 domain-containing protein [Gallicola sp.]|nr:DUF2752 domain-containing protein [Gallicola sp.]